MEEFQFEITQEEFQNIWELYAWPQFIKKQIAEVEKSNQISRWRMIRELRTNQKQLEETIFLKNVRENNQTINNQKMKGYNHSYFFITTFLNEHFAFHMKYLR